MRRDALEVKAAQQLTSKIHQWKKKEAQEAEHVPVGTLTRECKEHAIARKLTQHALTHVRLPSILSCVAHSTQQIVSVSDIRCEVKREYSGLQPTRSRMEALGDFAKEAIGDFPASLPLHSIRTQGRSRISTIAEEKAS